MSQPNDIIPHGALKRLTVTQWQQYQESGFLSGLPIFDGAGVQKLHEVYDAFQHFPERSAEGLPLSFCIWHEPALLEVITHSVILDYVEDVLGPDFSVWAARFFVKPPQSRARVVWHQDSVYWPLTPPHSVTVWMAVYDAASDNAAIQVIPGSHRGGTLRHAPVDARDTMHGDVEIVAGQFDPHLAKHIALKAGELSLHDSRLIHGSAYNESDRLRCGLTIRYSATDVQCDLSVWPGFKAYLVRGEDRYKLNPSWTPARSG